MRYVQDPQFGEIIDYSYLKNEIKGVIDQLTPEYNLLGSLYAATENFQDDPNYMTATAASGLAYTMLLAAEETELAEKHKYDIFTLGWTEEHCGTDLLSIYTKATPLSDDPAERQFHIKGNKWIINNSYHADYHMVLAKIDPTQDGPRSLSIFLVPQSSTKNWERIETHVLKHMVLTKYDIDGPGILVGKLGHGLSILQRMAMPSKYQCTYGGMIMAREAIPATIEHLSSKFIFGDHPTNFSNVFRQLYNLSLSTAFVKFTFFRALALSDSSFLQFHGTMLKSWLLLYINELLRENLLVAGSKGFVKESVIGRGAIDSFVFPVFDGHYTLNTLMSAKHINRYIDAERQEDAAARIEFLKENMYIAKPGNQMSASSGSIRKPDFFNWAEYLGQLDIDLPFSPENLLSKVNEFLKAIDVNELSNDLDYKYKIGQLLQGLEAILASCEMVAILGEAYYNIIPQQYNRYINMFNEYLCESAFEIELISPVRQRKLEQPADVRGYLLDLLDVRNKIQNS
ncbi:hypothetical protein MASR2M15_09580 [Anaerolineales bacterium]